MGLITFPKRQCKADLKIRRGVVLGSDDVLEQAFIDDMAGLGYVVVCDIQTRRTGALRDECDMLRSRGMSGDEADALLNVLRDAGYDVSIGWNKIGEYGVILDS